MQAGSGSSDDGGISLPGWFALAVVGGMDPGTCTPGDVDAQGFIVQVFCPLAPVKRVRVDLGDREDAANVALPVPATVLGGTGSDRITTGAPADEVHHQRDGEQHQEDEEEDLGDPHGRAGHRSEAEHRRDESDDQKGQGPSKHGVSPTSARCDQRIAR